MNKQEELKKMVKEIVEEILDEKENKEETMNKWEEACKGFLEGCSQARPNLQEECSICLKTFCDQLRDLEIEEKRFRENILDRYNSIGIKGYRTKE